MKLTKECDSFEVLNGHLEDEATSRRDQHCHQHRGPSNLVMVMMLMLTMLMLAMLTVMVMVITKHTIPNSKYTQF